MAALHISDNDFQEKVIKSDKPVLVDFFATWCGPCKMAGPVLDKLADEFTGKVEIVKMDVDENPQIPGKFGVMSIPTVMMFKDGQVVDQKVGFGGEAGYRAMIDKVSTE